MKIIRTRDDQYIIWDNIALMFVGKNDKIGMWELYIGLQNGMAIGFIDVTNCDTREKALTYLEAAVKRINKSVEPIIDLVEISKDMNNYPENYGIPTLKEKDNG